MVVCENQGKGVIKIDRKDLKQKTTPRFRDAVLCKPRSPPSCGVVSKVLDAEFIFPYSVFTLLTAMMLVVLVLIVL